MPASFIHPIVVTQLPEVVGNSVTPSL